MKFSDMSHTVYSQTARKSSTKRETVYAFGRKDGLHGHPVSEGGYSVWKLAENYDGNIRGGIRKTWRYIELDLSYSDAIKLMNKRLKRTEYKEIM